MAEFRLLLESSIDINEELVIVGDFNIHVENPSNYKGTTFNQILEDMRWIQLVQGRTHKAGHTLDLVIVRSGNSFVTEVEVSTLTSDHHLVECSIGLSRFHPVRRTFVENCSARNAHYNIIFYHRHSLLIAPATQLRRLFLLLRTTYYSLQGADVAQFLFFST